MLTDSALGAPFAKSKANAVGGDVASGEMEWHRLR